MKKEGCNFEMLSNKKIVSIVALTCVLAANYCLYAKSHAKNLTTATAPVELAKYKDQSSAAHIEPVTFSQKHGLALIFEGTHDLHYYAKHETAPAVGYELKVTATSDAFTFGNALFPKWEIFKDLLGTNVEVYAGNFTVFLPIETAKNKTQSDSTVNVKVSGVACTSEICLQPFEKTIQANINWAQRDSWTQIVLEKPIEKPSILQKAGKVPSYSVVVALAIAFLAGLLLNIMPCVWPVLPLIVMRIIEQAEKSRGKSLAMGLVFCLGIISFFACLAGANIVSRVVYQTAMGWGDLFRVPGFVTAMALFLIMMALFMFGVFTITVPSAIASKSGSGKGYSGAIGMGFLAAILSTPCSFAILGTAFAWAQGQTLLLGTIAILFIGLGMALPYAILTQIPGILKRLPKAGRWMELFRQALGFLLLFIAVKMIKAVPGVGDVSILYFAVVLSFCAWMWGTWVGYGTKLSRKVLIRAIAVGLVVLAWHVGFTTEIIQWQPYNANLIEQAKTQNQPTLIKFTADWCTNCDFVDRVVYHRKDIARLVERKGVLAIKADTTENDQPATLDLKNLYNEPGVPVTMLFLPGQTEPVRLHEIFFAAKLKELLEELPLKQDYGQETENQKN